MKDRLKELAESIGEMIQELEAAERSEKEKPKIDWSIIPKGTWVEVCDHEGDMWSKRRFYAYDPQNSNGHFHITCSSFDTREHFWRYCRLIENPPQPWFGGECPLPDGVRFKYWLRNGIKREYECCRASLLDWSHSGVAMGHEIIAFQILGEY